MYKKRTVWGILAVFLLGVFLTGCTGGSSKPGTPGQQPGPGASAPKEPIKLGVLFSLTGPFSLLGEQELAGVKFLADKINNSGGLDGRKLELIIHDIESKPDNAVTLAKKLIQQDKVIALVGLESLAVATPVIPVVEEAKIPMMAAMGLAPPKSARFSFASYPSGDLTVYGDLWYVQERLKGSKIGILAATDGIGQWAKNTALPAQLKRLGSKMNIIATESFTPADKDVTTQLTKLQLAKPDGIMVASTGAPVVTVAKNAKQMGLKTPLVGFGNAITPEFIKLIGDAGDAMIFSSPKALIWDQMKLDDPQRKMTESLATEYQKVTGKQWTLNHGVGYDTLLPVVEAIKAVGAESQKIRDHIENNQKNMQGAAGVWNRSPDDHVGTPIDSYVMVTIKNGRVELVSEVK